MHVFLVGKFKCVKTIKNLTFENILPLNSFQFQEVLMMFQNQKLSQITSDTIEMNQPLQSMTVTKVILTHQLFQQHQPVKLFLKWTQFHQVQVKVLAIPYHHHLLE